MVLKKIDADLFFMVRAVPAKRADKPGKRHLLAMIHLLTPVSRTTECEKKYPREDCSTISSQTQTLLMK